MTDKSKPSHFNVGNRHAAKPEGQKLNAYLPLIRVSHVQLQRYQDAAKQHGVGFAKWVRQRLDHGANNDEHQ